ncbi:GspH/FimT family pseudopilin [Marinobacter sediminicola]|uniref:GspH/FimT family pseudopilin n=1 Tax=Marinobacter sediminicola TaxID=3072994 RepID=UPI00281165FF|nr:GspH/FimT family pseudopilin [Marinobacter sp. F26243]
MHLRENSGFTLIELMVTLVVIAIVAMIAVPAMSDMVTRSRTTAAYNELQGLVGYARSESAKSPAQSVLLCSSNNGTSCTGQTDWSTGWLVARDLNGNGSVDVADTVLKVAGELSAGISLNVKTGASSDFNTTTVSLIRNGAPAGGNQITFKLCDAFGASEARGVVLSVSGQARAAARDSNGNREDHNNIDFQC